jgi:hypothetical protein
MQSGMTGSVRESMVLPAKPGRCACGFSGLQINALSVLKARHEVISYWQIATLIQSVFDQQITEDAVRGALWRLYRQGFLVRQRANRAHLKGNRYAFNADPCGHIKPYPELMRSDLESAAQNGMHSAETTAPSILKEIDRNNTLSISSEDRERMRLEALSEADMVFHWPRLAGDGFGTYQIRQIIERLEQKNLPLSNVLRGLEHAEWELNCGLMKDKDGKAVAMPTNWVFLILAKQGYYPRPAGYVSPQEKAERDTAEEKERLAAALEERLKAECGAWIAGLSENERWAILGDKNDKVRMPDDVALRNHFRVKIWPKLQSGGGK